MSPRALRCGLAMLFFFAGMTEIALAQSVSSAVAQLGGKHQGERYRALQALLPQIPDGMSGSDIAQLLGDPKDAWRSGMVKLIAPKARLGLSAAETATVLGDTNTGHRYKALEALVPRISGDLSGQDIHQILGDPKDAWRSGMVELIAPKARLGLSAAETATVLGDTNTGHRYGALQALAPKVKFGLSEHEVEQIIGDPRDSWRPAMAKVLASRSQPPIASGGLGVGGALPSTATAGSTPAQVGVFDGTYFNEAFRFGFRISGNQGIATVSNSLKYQVGDVMLRFRSTGPRSFSGEQLCTDGVFHPVSGSLIADGSLDMTIQGCSPSRYKMIRRTGPVLQSQSTASGPSGGQTGASAAAAERIRRGIEVRREYFRTVPTYLYSTDGFVASVATVWMDITGGLIGVSDPRSRYEEFYYAALEYRSMALAALTRAGRSLAAGELDRAEAYLDLSDSYRAQYLRAQDGAAAIYSGQVERAYAIAKAINVASKAATAGIAKAVWGPSASATCDKVWVITDWIVATAIQGSEVANRQLLIDMMAKAVVSQIPSPIYQGRTIERELTRSVQGALTLAKLDEGLREVLRSSQFQEQAITIMRTAAPHAAVQLTKNEFSKAIDESFSQFLTR